MIGSLYIKIFVTNKCVLSRKYFLYIPGRNIISKEQPGMKLNDKKIKYIIREKNKRRSSTEIAGEMKITTGYVNYIYKKYRDNGEYKINNRRRTREINNDGIEIIKVSGTNTHYQARKG